MRPTSRKHAGLDCGGEDPHAPPPRDEATGGPAAIHPGGSSAAGLDQARLDKFSGRGRPLQPERGAAGRGPGLFLRLTAGQALLGSVFHHLQPSQGREQDSHCGSYGCPILRMRETLSV